MGGHGGLNILPQKKWNVYNHDNRAIVDRDKKIAETKKKQKYEQDRMKAIDGKIQVLMQDQGYVEKKKQHADERLANSLNDEFKKLNEKTHINLFEREQKIIENKELLEIKRLAQTEFLKDKNMDYSSKFLGTYAEGGKKSPWYIRQKGFNDEKKRPSEISHLISVKKSDSNTLGQVIKIEAKQEKHREGQTQQFERSREKRCEAKSEIEILREKRLKREQKQREKALKLKESRKYG